MTHDEIKRTEFFQVHLNTAADWLATATRAFFADVVQGEISPCESPLEAAFVVWWEAARQVSSPFLQLDFQRAVVCGDQTYRVDLVIEPAYGPQNWAFQDLRRHPGCPRIAIELDGHEFHERTREQVTYRNRRDRALLEAGWLVLHFSGSEFHRRPNRVVYEAYAAGCRRFAEAMVTLGFWKPEQRENFLVLLHD